MSGQDEVAQIPPGEEADQDSPYDDGAPSVSGRAFAWLSGWLARVQTGQTRAEWPVAWYAFLLTAVAGLIASLPAEASNWYSLLAQEHPGVRWRVGWMVLHPLLNAAWRGAFLGLGLLALDRLAGGWSRRVRWALAGAVFTGILVNLVHTPTDWRYLVTDVRVHGLRALAALPTCWQGALWRVGVAAASAFWGWWVAGAVSREAHLHRRLAVAGLQASVIAFFLTIPFLLPLWLWPPQGTAPEWSWPLLWGMSAVALVQAGIGGLLDGLAIALALSPARPAPASESPRHQLPERVEDVRPHDARSWHAALDEKPS